MSKPLTIAYADPDQLLTWSADARSRRRFSALGEHIGLLVDAQAFGDARLAPQLAAWLRELPCPSIAIASDANALSAACDTRLGDPSLAAPLIATIEQAPVAASVLVQLLRVIEHATIDAALTTESLAYASLQAGPEFLAWQRSHEPEATPADPGPPVLIKRKDDALRLRLNRPSRRNAMTVEMREALCEALELVLMDSGIRHLVIAAAGKCFSTGGDPDEFGTAPDPASAHLIRSLSLPGRLLAACSARTRVEIHGACIGSGIEFPAFAAQIRARPGSYFQLPELRYGLIPGAGGCVSISRRIGRQRTAWMALSGQRVKVHQALEWGLVDALWFD